MAMTAFTTEISRWLISLLAFVSFLFRVGDFLDELLRILVEILFAGFAAKLDFFALVVEHERVAHFPQFFVRDDALRQWVLALFGFFVALVLRSVRGER